MISPVRRLLRILSVSLTTAGIVILLDAGITLAWQEPISAIYGSIRQNQAESQLQDIKDDFLSQPAVVDLPPAKNIDARAEELAARSGHSLNTWLVNVVRAATREGAINVDIDLSSIPFVGGTDPSPFRHGNRRMSGWV